jgi:hypothetical protein
MTRRTPSRSTRDGSFFVSLPSIRTAPAGPALTSIVVVVFATIAGCGGGAGARAKTAGELRSADPTTLLDPESFAVLRVDLARLRTSPHYDQLSAIIDTFRSDRDGGGDEAAAPGADLGAVDLASGGPSGKEGDDASGPKADDGGAPAVLPGADGDGDDDETSLQVLAALDQTDQLYLGLSARPPGAAGAADEPVVTVVLVGAPDPAALQEAMLDPAHWSRFDPELPGEPDAVGFASDEGFLIHDGHGLALGADLGVRPEALARWSAPDASPLARSPVLAELAQEVPLSDAVVVGLTRALDVVPDEESAPSWVRGLQAGAVRMDLMRTFDVRLLARFDDPAIAASLAEDMRDAVARSRGNPFVGLFGLGDVLTAVTIEENAGELRAGVFLDEAGTTRIVQTLGGIAAFVQQMNAGGDGFGG